MPFPFKATFSTTNKTKWVNTCEYIILHHTATGEWTLKWVINTLTKGAVSCHFVVDTNGDAYKIGDPKDILWHAGVSEWKGKKMMNNYSVGIEIIGPLANWGFSAEQKHTVYWLTQHLMAVLNIPKENVIRHKDISPWRKTDVADSFWNNKYKTYKDYQDTLKPREYK